MRPMSRRGLALTVVMSCLLGALAASAAFLLADRRHDSGVLPAADADLLAEVLGRIRADYVEDKGDHELMTGAVRGMVSGLDPHSAFMDQREFEDLRIATEGNYSGIGIEVTLESGSVIVISPIDGSPAARAGIRPGDRILAIDGRVIESGVLADSVARIRGASGTMVRLSIGREAAPAPVEFLIERALVSVHSVRQAMLEPGYGYLRISQFSETTGADLGRALHALQAQAGGKLRGLVLDLRNNPGGVLDAAVEVSDAFLDRGLIVTAEGRSPESRFRMDAATGDLAGGAPIAVLVNEGSASAAEIVAGALRDNGRAALLGRRTFGKGSVQTVLPLTHGQALKLTTSRYFTPSGVSIQGRGIQPDVELPAVETAANADTAGTEADADIRAGIAWLKSGRPAVVAADSAPVRR